MQPSRNFQDNASLYLNRSFFSPNLNFTWTKASLTFRATSPTYNFIVTAQGKDNYLMCVVTILLLCALVITLILLRKINDQFKLWFELVVVLVTLCVVAIVRSILFFPAAASSMMQDVGSDLSALFLASALFLMLMMSSLYPALLTFTFRFRSFPRATHSTLQGEMNVNAEMVVIFLVEVLNDPFGLNLYKQFALESFAVENVTCWS